MTVWRQLLLIGFFGIGSAAFAADNLVTNGAFEGAKGGELPPGWEELIVGAPATIATDSTEKHGGQSSVRISAADISRSYVRSTQPIEIAAGETIRGSAWVKTKDVPAGKGAVIMIAEFSDGHGGHESVEKINVADVAKGGEWQRIEGSATVPAGAQQLRLRLGFSYSQGTCWWDDVNITSVSPISARAEFPEGQLTPALAAVPVTVLNRDGRRGEARVLLTLNGKPFPKSVRLSGKPIEADHVSITPPTPGKMIVALKVLDSKDEKKVLFEPPPWNGVVPAPLVLYPPSPTHWAMEDGNPQIDYRFDLYVGADVGKTATITAELRGASDNNVIKSWPIKPPNDINSFKYGTNHEEHEFGKAIPAGDYTLVVNVKPKNGKPLVATHPWHVIRREQAKVTLNAGGYPVADGKAIFPLGIFNGGKFKEQAAAGFTVTHAYNAVRLEENARNADFNALRYLDGTQENGMKMLFMIPMKAAIKGDFDAVRRRIRMFRNHPALLAWDEEEGFARGDFKPDTLKKIRQIQHEEDPHHPFMVGDSRGLGAVRGTDRSDFFPDDDMDLGMWWWYPFPLQERTGDALLGEDAGPPGKVLVPPSFLVTAKTKKPLWVGVQSYKKPGKDSRYPTPQEYRAQAYLGIVSGARGLMWYGGSVTGGLFLAAEEGHWPDLQNVVREIHGLESVLLEPNAPTPTVSPDKSAVSVCLKKTADRLVLIAVNRGETAAEVTISSPAFKHGTAQVLGEQYKIKVDAGSLHDRFEPYAVHVYELSPP
jgi:hypothetical protein